MPTYEFTVTLQGIGEDIEQAWQDAVETFTLDPGWYDEDGVKEVEPGEEAV